MFIFKRTPVLPKSELVELKNFVSKTIELMLMSKEETIYTIKKYDLVLAFSWEGDYIEGSIFRLSTFTLSENGSSICGNVPLFVEKRYFHKQDKSIVYIDPEKIKGLTKPNLLAFHGLCELIRIFDVEVISSDQYKVIWKDE